MAVSAHFSKIVRQIKTELTSFAALAATAAQAWAEGTLPGGIGTKSSKEWSADAQAMAEFIAVLGLGAIYDTVPEGVAPVTGVASGEFFLVWENERLPIYVNDAGVAVKKAELPTTALSLSPIYSDLASSAAGKGGSLVAFLQSGTGAVSRSVTDRLLDAVSVFDFMTPAQIADVRAGTLLVDVSSAVQAAIDHCKGKPGVTLRFPRGWYRIDTSLNNTYAGAASGLSSGYYGFSIVGDDPWNTVIVGRNAGTPTLDCTGKPRMTFRNIGFANYTDDANKPSCLLLLARNTTNSFAGGHLFDRVIFRGYVTKTLVQTASSEVNHWINVQFEPFSNEVSSIELTDQIQTGVNSSYINLAAHTFSGGNTRHEFLSCSFNQSVPTSGTRAVNLAAVDGVSFIDCYANSKATATFDVTGDCSSVAFINHRDESGSTYFLRVGSGKTLSSLYFSGRASRAIYGEDTSTITRADICPDFIATATTYSVDGYNLTDSDVRGITNNIRVRNSANRSRFHDKKPAAEWSLPTGDLTSPEFYWLSYTGGSANYTRKVENQNKYKRHELGRMHISRLVLPTTEVADFNSTTYPSGYTPDLDVASSYNFTATGDGTINAPINVNPGPNDPTGQILILTICQDATGGRTITLPSTYDLQGATIPTAAYGRITVMFIAQNTTGGFKWMRVT